MAQNITLTANLKSILGAASLNGYLEITLCGFGIIPPRVPADSVMLGDSSIPQVNGPASTFSVKLYGNDQITPSGTFYSIAVLDQNKNVIQAGIYQLTGTNTFDLSQLNPIVPASAIGAGISVAIFQASPTLQGATGTVNGINTLFTFSAPSGTTPLVLVMEAGIYQTGFGASPDYTLSDLGGNVWQISFTNPPVSGPITVLRFQLNGAGSRTIAAPATIVVSGSTPDNTLFCNFTTAGAITLPSASAAGVSYELTFKDVSGNAAVNNITLSGSIEGGSSYVINTNHGCVTIRSDGSAWWIKSKL